MSYFKTTLSRLAAASGVVLITASAMAGIGYSNTGFGPASAGADALCDQMREQYGPSWPCINVPTNTPPPTMMPQPTSPGRPTNPSGNGPVIGGDAGSGPGVGNGTPIVPVPSPTRQQSPGRSQAPSASSPAPATDTPVAGANLDDSVEPSPVSRFLRDNMKPASWWSPGCITWRNDDGSCAGSNSGKQIMKGAVVGGTGGMAAGCFGGAVATAGPGCVGGAAVGAGTGMIGGAVTGAWNAWG
ncbi:hypothetical protein JOC45_002927 [Gordonia hydrophobica]|nr:hypothetical protein [Gordonia hydrophobica]